MRIFLFSAILCFNYFFSYCQNLAGNWKGDININGNQIPIIFHFYKDSLGNIEGKWDSPKQKAIGLPFSNIQVNKDSILLDIKMIAGTYKGKFTNNDSIAGTWQQNGAVISLNFSRSTEDFPTDIKTILSPNEKEISITSGAGNKLYGTLLSKNNKQKLVIIIAGSGPTDRDGNNPLGDKADSYKMLAHALDSQGIASFRYDKRGVAKSIPADFNPANIVFEDYVKDAESIFNYLHYSLGYNKIYFIGHSEGSLIGMLAAKKCVANGYVSVAGAGRPIDRVIEEQENSSALPDSLKTKISIIFNQLKKGKFVNEIPSQLNMLFNKSIQPYFMSWLKYDPVIEIKKITCPILILQGTCDKQVKIEDAEKLHTANHKSLLSEIPLMTHTLKDANAGCVDENNKTYLDPSLPINKRLVEDIVSFLKMN